MLSPSKPVLYIDIDGVVADSVQWWLNLASVECWKPFPFEKHTSYSTMDCLGVNLAPYYMDYRGVQMVDGSKSALVRLNVYYDVRYVTVGFGEDWLRAQGLTGEVIRIKDRSLLRGYALIDDYEKNLEGFIGKKYLVKQPWNPNGWTWGEIEEDLLKDAYNGFANGVLWTPV
jgi:5'(3')-deoxyribonucleotidase